MMLLCIDPGAHTGWALFSAYGPDWHFDTLSRCGLTTPAKWDKLASIGALCDVLIEEPTIYPHSKARPADVMALQLKVGELKGRFEAVGRKVELVQPRTWKRSVPKRVHHARAARVLTWPEQQLVSGQRHDVWDAVCMGLWKLGRMK
jgi:hypothetical protein